MIFDQLNVTEFATHYTRSALLAETNSSLSAKLEAVGNRQQDGLDAGILSELAVQLIDRFA